MARRYFNYDAQQLEKEFEKNTANLDVLQELAVELGFRNTQRAKNLQAKVNQVIVSKKKTPLVYTNARPAHITPASIPDIQVSYVAPKQDDPDKPHNVLSAWSALEVLSPQSFKRPQDLANGGDSRLVASFNNHLPWENGGENARPNTRLYYQVILGTIPMDKAISKLLEVYSDSRDERPPAKGEAILAVIVVDRNGKPVQEKAVAISSFAWGIQHALQGDLGKLSRWVKAEQELVKQLDKRIRIKDEEDNDLPLNAGTLRSAFQYLAAELQLPAGLVSPNQFAIRVYEWFKNPEAPEPLLLNSFFLNDISTAAALFTSKQATGNLKKYIGVEVPKTRKDLSRDFKELERMVSPELIPAARWPSPGNSALVLLQQAAVNTALAELKPGGITSVNGPPGTGKTTLLRDLVAGIICDRAEALCAFDDPENVFSHSGQKLAAGQAWLHLYQVNPKIRGYEILIASSNNKAVENISAELPGINAIGNLPGLRYFNALSDILLERETWGLVAAVLGNGANRAKFRKTFWWDEDFGMSTYLAEAAGTPQFINIVDPQTQQITGTRKPKIITLENPPDNHVAALVAWNKARQEFITVLNACRAELKVRADLRALVIQLPGLLNKAGQARQQHDRTKENSQLINLEIKKLRQSATQLTSLGDSLRQQHQSHRAVRPNWLKLLFNTDPAKAWRAREKTIRDIINQNTHDLSQEKARITHQEAELVKNNSLLNEQAQALKNAEQQYSAAAQKIAAMREKLGDNIIDEAFFAARHEHRQQLSPWNDPALAGHRDRVFSAAIQLQKAFITAAAKPLRHNLGALMMLFNGKELSDKAKQALVPDLWSTLFLVVPAISTTFASVERMMGTLPPESLGWLLVDEAGQALPQAAVGALMRTKRAVIVGDPIQIEPIVTLPESLTKAINKHFAIDPDKFNAPEASAQTLADAASAYYADFESKNGSRSVGIPLLVHRRCSNPMFQVANQVAYNNLMVQAKPERPSSIRNALGNSAWIHVQGAGTDKWCPDEGAAVLTLLRKLKTANVPLDLYIISPFVIVADNLRQLITQSGMLQGMVADPYLWVYERIGTVHIVQGREAEAVIFVLGAPLSSQAGARGWAGGRPNLLNVAVTRAKEALYVIGNRDLWQSAGTFSVLARSLPL
ncbi:MAG: AAA domain-containing protein [Bacteroidota bacterium]